MNEAIENEIFQERAIQRICDFFRLEDIDIKSTNLKETIKELCALRLFKALGLSNNFNYKSDFFNFFASIMGEAVCEKLNIKIHVASDELRLVKYNRVNLVQEIKSYLESETVEEAFLDAFDLVDRFKYLIPYLKKSS